MSPPPSRRHALRAAAAVLALAALPRPGRTQGRGDPQAEQFVRTAARQFLQVLSDRGLSVSAKETAIRQLIDQIVDVPRITGFVLGKYARTITPAQRQAFNIAFRAYAESVYQRHISDFRGETLTVAGSVVRKPGDVVVATVIAGGAGREPRNVSWRLLNGGGGWRVVDAQISGVWLAITQQQDFVSTIDNARGDINVLIAQLQNDVRQKRVRK